MRIFCFVGSNNFYSVSTYIARIMQKKLNFLKDISCNVYTFRELKIQPCIGCKKCFQNICCPLDSKDNFDKIKEDFLTSDFVILITPVYAINISGAMKYFIDRIAYLLCKKCLTNKKSIIISVTDSTGAELTDLYLTNLMCQSGSTIVKSYQFIKKDVELNSAINELTDDIYAQIKEVIKK